MFVPAHPDERVGIPGFGRARSSPSACGSVSATGASLDRYYATPGTRRITSFFGPFLLALIAIGLVLEWVADLRWSMAVCGLVALIATVFTGRRLDKVLVEELRPVRKETRRLRSSGPRPATTR